MEKKLRLVCQRAEFQGKQYRISTHISEKPLAAQIKKISFENFSISVIQQI